MLRYTSQLIPANYLRGGQACNPQVSFVRHVHYVSGACLLANKTAFSAANGFRSEIYEVMM